jgi:hypothetical protein
MIQRLLIVATLASAALASAPPVRAQDSAESDKQELKAYRLTMDKIVKMNAVDVKLRRLAATDSTVCQALDLHLSDGDTLTLMAKKREAAHPQIAPIMKSEGLTVRESLLISFSVLAAGMAVYAKSQGEKDLPPDDNPENVAFIEQHQKELDAMSAELKKIPNPCKKKKSNP